jgi:Flp pilus assembly protein TadG
MIFIIIDFGWLFYNYVSVENAARNAARKACINYQFTSSGVAESGGGIIPIGSKDYTTEESIYDTYYKEEKAVVNEVTRTITNSAIKIENINVTYTADSSGQVPTFTNRSKGDVVVVVTCRLPVFTPVLGSGSDGMKIKVKASSTYKVEKNPNVSDDFMPSAGD